MDPATIIQGINAILPFFKGFGGQQEAEWRMAMLMDLLNYGQAQTEFGKGVFQGILDPTRQSALDLLGPTGGNLINLQDMLTKTGEFYGGNADHPGGYMADIFKNAGGLYQTPEMEALARQLSQYGGDQFAPGGVGATADQLFLGGGWTPQYQNAFDTMDPYMRGWGNNSQIALGDVGANLLGQRGQTAYTQGYQDRGMDALNAGGQNPWLTNALNQATGRINNMGYTPGAEQLIQQGLSVLQSGGATPWTNAGSNAALQGFQQQGENPFTLAGQDLGLDYASREALLSPEAMVNFARGEAADISQSRAKQAYRQAAARGTGAGAVTMSGIENQMRADFGQEANQLEADMVRKALMDRQGLGLQQNQMGAGLLGQQGGLASQRMGTFGDTLGSLQGVANQRFGIGANLAGQGEQIAAGREQTAFGAIPGTQGAANQVMQILGNLGLGAMGVEGERMGLGNQMSQTLLGSQNAAMQNYINTMANQNQYALGGGALGTNRYQLGGNLLNNAYQNYLNAGQLGVNRANNMAGQVNNAFGNMLNLYGLYGQQYQNAMNPLISLAGQANQYAQTGLGGIFGLDPKVNQGSSIWSSIGGVQLPKPGEK